MQLWLLEAAPDDTSAMFTQIQEFKSFQAQATSSSGKGPCCLMHDMANRATQICVAKAYMAEFSNKHAPCKALEKDGNPQVFMPSGGARHRPAKTKTGIDRTIVKKRNRQKQLPIKICM